MSISPSINIIDLASYGVKVWFWNHVRNSEPLKALWERVTGEKSIERRYDKALHESLNFAADFLKKKKILSERTVDMLDGTARFLLADQKGIQRKLEDAGSYFFDNTHSGNDSFKRTVEESAGFIAGSLQSVRGKIQYKAENSDNPQMPKKILATYHHYYRDGMANFEKRVLAHKGWDKTDRFILKRVFKILKNEAAQSEFAQIDVEDAQKWKAGMGILNEILTNENPDIQKHLEVYAPRLGTAIKAARTAAQGAQKAIELVEWGAPRIEVRINAGLSVLTDGAVALAEKAMGAVDQLELATLGPLQTRLPAEALPKLLLAVESEDVANPAADAAADASKYFPLGDRSQILVEQTRLTGTAHAASVHSHAHAESEVLDELMLETCASALSQARQEWRPVEFAGDILLSSAFLRQQEKMRVNFPQAPDEMQSYYACAWNIGKAGWNYGMSWLGYQETPEQQQLRQRVHALDHACRGNKELMQEASHYLDNAFAEACLLEPLNSLRVGGEESLLRFPTRSGESLLRMHPDGPRYAYTVERKGDDATTLTIEASWEIQAYGQDAASLKPESSSAVRTSVQLILRASDDGTAIDATIHPLGISASIDNQIVFNTRKSA